MVRGEMNATTAVSTIFKGCGHQSSPFEGLSAWQGEAMCVGERHCTHLLCFNVHTRRGKYLMCICNTHCRRRSDGRASDSLI
jgi:hypothetical protein